MTAEVSRRVAPRWMKIALILSLIVNFLVIGAAVGALNVLGAGVYVCMNGRIFDAMRAGRDGRTGKFISAIT